MESSQKLTGRWEKLGCGNYEAKGIDLYADWVGVRRRKTSHDGFPSRLKICCERCSGRAEALDRDSSLGIQWLWTKPQNSVGLSGDLYQSSITISSLKEAMHQ